jgi:hypothetical protein
MAARERLREDGGSVAVLVALAMAALAGFAALGVDVARAYAQQQRLNQAASSAALAGAQSLPADPAAAQQTALQYAAENGVPAGDVATQVSSDDTTLSVTAGAPYAWTFGRVLGLPPLWLTAQAAAQVGVLDGVQGAQPWGVPQQDFQPGQSYVVKTGPSGETGGNFYPLALGGNGASQYEQNVEQGYPGWLSVGETVSTETGDMSGPTEQGLEYRIEQDPNATWDDVSADSPRLLRLPVVTASGDGKSQVQVVALAVFFLQGLDGSGDVTGIFENAFVAGQWCRLGSAGCQDEGAYAVKLVQ